jgi:four helix bundle protein
MRITRFEDLECWQAARELVQAVYAVTNQQPFRADRALCDQVRRAAGSVMHNIAEGFDCGSDADFVRFLRYAQRSCAEVQSELYVALDQHYISEPVFQDLYDLAARVQSLIGGFIRYLKASSRPSSIRPSSERSSSGPSGAGRMAKR